MEKLKKLNLKALESRMTKTVSTEEALRSVTPFPIEPSSNDTKILVKKDIRNV